jgi:hypothetical protein
LHCAGQRPLGFDCKLLLVPRDESSGSHADRDHDNAQRNAKRGSKLR